MKKGTRVIVSGMLGTIVGEYSSNPLMFQVFLDETKKVYNFLSNDLKEIERKEIFCGYWKERKIDKEKWRIYLPFSIREKFKDLVFLALRKDNVVVILNNNNVSEEYIIIIETPIEKNNRITIPPILRNSVSFFFEEKIDLAEFKDRLEIWPCP